MGWITRVEFLKQAEISLCYNTENGSRAHSYPVVKEDTVASA
jgi:hypothetical protein